MSGERIGGPIHIVERTAYEVLLDIARKNLAPEELEEFLASERSLGRYHLWMLTLLAILRRPPLPISESPYSTSISFNLSKHS